MSRSNALYLPTSIVDHLLATKDGKKVVLRVSKVSLAILKIKRSKYERKIIIIKNETL